MAATDQTYRSQRALDIVFSVTSILMLVSIVGMFIQDYQREWKTEQRQFRDVEAEMFTRLALADLPDPKKYEEAKQAVDKARAGREQKIKVKVKDGDQEKVEEVTVQERIDQ